MIQQVDSSLVDAWEALTQPEASKDAPDEVAPPFDLAQQPALLAARVRSDLHGLVRALADCDYEKAASCVFQDPGDSWGPARFETALAPYFEEYERIEFTPDARNSRRTLLKPAGSRVWDVSQVLVDPVGDNFWVIEGRIDLSKQREPDGPIVHLQRIGQ
jgi:hypothetical protein